MSSIVARHRRRTPLVERLSTVLGVIILGVLCVVLTVAFVAPVEPAKPDPLPDRLECAEASIVCWSELHGPGVEWQTGRGR